MELTTQERRLADGDDGPSVAMAMRIVIAAAELMGAERLVEVCSAHIDGCLYHGDGGVEFARRLLGGGARVRVFTTLNVGALDLVHKGRVRADSHTAKQTRRLMNAYVEMGCQPTWTCAPYQSGHRPKTGEQVAWGESNAVVFANSVLGARTNRYGDYLDICCALTGRAPYAGLHVPENRHATIVIDTGNISDRLKSTDAFYPVFGTWFGATVKDAVAVIAGLPEQITEDQLKALGAASSSSGAVGLFHAAGVTPEAPDLETALGHQPPHRTIAVTSEDLRPVRDRLSTTQGPHIDAVAVGSPHFSIEEFAELESLTGGRTFDVPFYVCTSRSNLERLQLENRAEKLESAGVVFVADTCIVVAPILPPGGGVLMTNSGKFAHYTPANTGFEVVFGGLEDCVESAISGRITRDESLWD